jgi:hypothetical protein
MNIARIFVSELTVRLRYLNHRAQEKDQRDKIVMTGTGVLAEAWKDRGLAFGDATPMLE